MTPAESHLRAAVENGYPHHTLTIKDGRELLAEIDRLRAAVQHEADCVEAAKAEIAELEIENWESAEDNLQLISERDEARAECERFRAALNTVARTLDMPFPDPGAHSARAYHEAVFVAWSRSNQTARAALAQIEQERSEQAKADDSMLQWIKLTDRMPNPDEHGRVLIFTEGYDFNGEQVFDVKAETLNECFYADPDYQPEVCRVASHWMPHPTEWRPCECESQYDD